MEKPARRKYGFRFCAAIIALLPAIYAASFGPACWFVVRTDVGHELCSRMYCPLNWLANRSPTVSSVMRQYARLGAPADSELVFGPNGLEWWVPIGAPVQMPTFTTTIRCGLGAADEEPSSASSTSER